MAITQIGPSHLNIAATIGQREAVNAETEVSFGKMREDQARMMAEMQASQEKAKRATPASNPMHLGRLVDTYA